jgi:hypothetical protein
MPLFFPFRRLEAFLSIVLAFASLAAGQTGLDRYDNPILRPKKGEVIPAGTTYNITWKPNKGDIVSMELWSDVSLANSFNGSNCGLDTNSTFCTSFIENVTNSGSYLWQIPRDAPSSRNYYIDIYVPDPGLGGPFYYFTANFTITNATTPSSTVISSTGSPTTTETSPVSSTTFASPSGMSAASKLTSRRVESRPVGRRARRGGRWRDSWLDSGFSHSWIDL